MTKVMNKIAIILNGPPGCGKDAIANSIINITTVEKRQFKDALYEHTAKHFNVDLDKFIKFASDRELKDSKSLAGLGGRTPRQALIHVSENIYKPRFGSDYFGKVEALKLSELAGRLGGSFNVIYPDGGFTDECTAIEPELDLLIIIRLHRDGFDFLGDSRDYINLPDTEARVSIDISLLDGLECLGVSDVMHNVNKIIDGKLNEF